MLLLLLLLVPATLACRVLAVPACASALTATLQAAVTCVPSSLAVPWDAGVCWQPLRYHVSTQALQVRVQVRVVRLQKVQGIECVLCHLEERVPQLDCGAAAAAASSWLHPLFVLQACTGMLYLPVQCRALLDSSLQQALQL
jgi:hypothetical protein